MGNILGKQGERKAKEGSKADADAAEKGKGRGMPCVPTIM